MRYCFQNNSEISHNADGQLEPVQNRTPLDELIAAEADLLPIGDDEASALSGIRPDALLVILRFIVPTTKPGGAHSKKRWDVALLRLITLCHASGLEGVADLSQADLARELNCTRAILSLYATAMVDQLGQEQTRGGKRRQSRAVYRDTATASHIKRGHQMSQPS